MSAGVTHHQNFASKAQKHHGSEKLVLKKLSGAIQKHELRYKDQLHREVLPKERKQQLYSKMKPIGAERKQLVLSLKKLQSMMMGRKLSSRSVDQRKPNYGTRNKSEKQRSYYKKQTSRPGLEINNTQL